MKTTNITAADVGSIWYRILGLEIATATIRAVRPRDRNEVALGPNELPQDQMIEYTIKTATRAGGGVATDRFFQRNWARV